MLGQAVLRPDFLPALRVYVKAEYRVDALIYHIYL